MSEATIAPEQDGIDPDAVMRRLKEQAAYNATLVTQLTAGNQQITTALAELVVKRTDVDAKDKAYREQDVTGFGKLRERMDEVLPCLLNSLGTLAPLADQVVRSFRQEVAEAGRGVFTAQVERDRAKEQVDEGAAELKDKKDLLDKALTLPDDLTAALASLTAEEAETDPSPNTFEKYACATEIVRRLEEDVWVPSPDEYHDLVLQRWGDLVAAEQRQLTALAVLADCEGRLSQAEAAWTALTDHRVDQLLERWRQACKERAVGSVKEDEWGTPI